MLTLYLQTRNVKVMFHIVIVEPSGDLIKVYNRIIKPSTCVLIISDSMI